MFEPWQFDFFRRGITAATLAGGLCGFVGVYIVLRHMSYIGHGLSHAVFGGAVAAYVGGVNFYLGAAAWGVVSALVINAMSRRRVIGADAAIGIVTTASFAVGVALISQGRRFTRNLEAALFGNILGVTVTELYLIAGAGIFASACIFFLYKRLLFVTFDPEVAPVFGINSRLVDNVMALVLAATVISSMQVLGVTLIAATLVTPAVTARLMANSFRWVLAIATAVGALSGFVGMYISFYLDVASGATIVLVGATIFAGVYLGTSVRAKLNSRLAEDRSIDDAFGQPAGP